MGSCIGTVVFQLIAMAGRVLGGEVFWRKCLSGVGL